MEEDNDDFYENNNLNKEAFSKFTLTNKNIDLE